MRIFVDVRNWWIGYYRVAGYHYLCLIPTIVICWGNRAEWSDQAAAQTATPAMAPYQVCFECGTTYTTADELLERFNTTLVGPGDPEWTDARDMRFCPACLHDFLYPPVSWIVGELPTRAAEIVECLRHNGFDPTQAVNRNVLALAEEVGEFVGAYRRWSGQARRTGTAEDMWEELADVIITAFVTAQELGIDINAVIAAKLHKVHTRGWRDTTTPATASTHPVNRVRINLDGGAR